MAATQEARLSDVEQLAEWTTAFINTLPASAFLYIAPGGEKDDDGKTRPRSLRYFPYRDEDGKVDLPHLRNAIAQAPKADLARDVIAKVQAKGRSILEQEREEMAEDDDEKKDDEKKDEKKKAKQPFGPSLGNPAARRYYGEARLSAPVALADDSPKWVELARSGTHFGRGSDRRVELTADDLRSMVRGYDKIKSEGWFPVGAPVGFNHAAILGSRDPESTKAAGRIIKVRTQDNSDGSLSLYGLVQWTDEGRKRIRAGEFDGFSVEMIPSDVARSKKTGEPLGDAALIGGTLTNEPFVSGMQAVAASEQESTPRSDDTMSTTLSILRGSIALTEEASEAEVIAKVQALADQAAKVEALTESLETLTADRDALKTERDELAGWKQSQMLDQACEEGRIAASERDRYSKIVVALGEEEANAVFPVGRIPVEEKGATAPVEKADAKGLGAIDAAITALADRLAGEGLDAASAYSRAMSEVLSDPSTRAIYESETLN